MYTPFSFKKKDKLVLGDHVERGKRESRKVREEDPDPTSDDRQVFGNIGEGPERSRRPGSLVSTPKFG